MRCGSKSESSELTINPGLCRSTAFSSDSCRCNKEALNCHLEDICQSESHLYYGPLSPLHLFGIPCPPSGDLQCLPSYVVHCARAAFKNSFQAVKIISQSAEMDLHQLEPGTTRDLLRFQWGFSFLFSSLVLAQNRVCWREEMTFPGLL